MQAPKTTPALIRAGTGYHIDQDFYRVAADTPVELIRREVLPRYGRIAVFMIDHPRRGRCQAYTSWPLVEDMAAPMPSKTFNPPAQA